MGDLSRRGFFGTLAGLLPAALAAKIAPVKPEPPKEVWVKFHDEAPVHFDFTLPSAVQMKSYYFRGGRIIEEERP